MFLNNEAKKGIVIYTDENNNNPNYYKECNFIDNTVNEGSVVVLPSNADSKVANCYFSGDSVYFNNMDSDKQFFFNCYFENPDLFHVTESIKESCMTDDDSIRDTKSLFGTNVCKYDPPTPRTYPPEGCPALETPTHKTLRIRVIHTLSSAFVLDAI